MRKLEIEFEEKYKEIYNTREALINGKSEIDSELTKAFDEVATKMQDADYEKIEITPCDVKGI
jgi:predicted RNA methylase